jgi:hypothetical protein
VLAEQPTTLLQVPVAALRPLMDDEQFSTLVLSKLDERMVRLQLCGASTLGGVDQSALRDLRTSAPPAYEALAPSEARVT